MNKNKNFHRSGPNEITHTFHWCLSFSFLGLNHRHLINIDCLMPALFTSVVLKMAAAKEKEKEKKPINY